MNRRVIAIFAGLFLLACVAAWAHSLRYHARLDLPIAAGQRLTVDTWEGRVALSVGAMADSGSLLAVRSSQRSFPLWILTHQHEWSAAGFKLMGGDLSRLYEWPAPGTGYFVSLAIPLWLPVAVCGFVLASAIRHRKSRSPFACDTCDYDLRAHHPGDRCPECGNNVQPATNCIKHAVTPLPAILGVAS